MHQRWECAMSLTTSHTILYWFDSRTLRWLSRLIVMWCGRIQTCTSSAVTTKLLSYTERSVALFVGRLLWLRFDISQLHQQYINRSPRSSKRQDDALGYAALGVESNLAWLQAIKRALLVYAKLNPGIKYIQGMNEIYAPIYYHFATDTNKDAAEHAEADAFFCFVELISEFRDNFCQRLVSQQQLCWASCSSLSRSSCTECQCRIIPQ